MVARMSPLFELSSTALAFVMFIGAITALFMGFLGVIQNDIKRVIAYSTLSQLGYMTVALGASAYSVAVFHLMTHAFFKALLFLAAGSVIIGMHHDQDMRNMGGLRKYMPVTWITCLVGSLALAGAPFFSGFYSKDSIIEAVAASNLPGSGFAYFAVLSSVFITALYTFRLYFLVFHGKERFGKAQEGHHAEGEEHVGLAPGQKPHESPWVVTVPLIMLAIPSMFIGYFTIAPMLHGGFFPNEIYDHGQLHPAMSALSDDFHGALQLGLHGFAGAPFWLGLAGAVVAWFFWLKRPDIPAALARQFSAVYTLLENKYYFDKFNQTVIAGGSRALGCVLWKGVDAGLVDGLAVNGSARVAGFAASVMRSLQSGYVYHYAFAMVLGLILLLSWWVMPATLMALK
jgi:NADH-quinone oxidoreductase subunit L